MFVFEPAEAFAGFKIYLSPTADGFLCEISNSEDKNFYVPAATYSSVQQAIHESIRSILDFQTENWRVCPPTLTGGEGK